MASDIMESNTEKIEQVFLAYLKDNNINIKTKFLDRLSRKFDERNTLEVRVSSLIKSNCVEDFIKYLLKDLQKDDINKVLKTTLMYKELGKRKYNLFLQQIFLGYISKGSECIKTISSIFDSYDTYKTCENNNMHFGAPFMQNVGVLILNVSEKETIKFIESYGVNLFKTGVFRQLVENDGIRRLIYETK